MKAELTTGMSRSQVTPAAGSLGKLVQPAGVQAGQLGPAVGTVLGPQRDC